MNAKRTFTARRPKAKALPFSTSCSNGLASSSLSLPTGGARRCLTSAGTAPHSTITFTISSKTEPKKKEKKKHERNENRNHSHRLGSDRKRGITVLGELGEDVGGALGGGAIGVGPREGRVEELDLGPNLGDEGVVGLRGGCGAAGGEGWGGGGVVPIVVLLVLVLDHLELALLALALRRGVVAEVVVRPLLHVRCGAVRRGGGDRQMGWGCAVLGKLGAE